MGSLTELTKQAFGLAPLAPTALDRPLLKSLGLDGLGRTQPLQFVGNSSAQWLSNEGSELTRAGYTNHGTAYSVVGYILALGQNLPWGVYRLVNDKPQKLSAHPLYDLIYRPNARQSWADVTTALKGWLLLGGNAYAFAVRPALGSRAGKVGEVWVPDPARVEVLGGGFMQEVTGYHYRKADGSKVFYAAADVLHLMYWNPDDSKYGLSPIAAGIDAITASKAGLTARVRNYQNQGPPGVIYDESSTEPWDAGQSNTVRQWFRRFTGMSNARSGELPIVGGKLGYLKLGLGPVDLDLLAAIPHDKDAVADLYRFPGQLLNGSKGTTFANMGEAGKAAYNRCVIPLETQLRDGVNRWLGKDYNDEIYLDFSVAHVPELQEDKKALAEMLALCPFISNWRKQELMGEEVDKSVPEYTFPSSVVTLADLQAVPAMPPLPAPAPPLN